MNTMDNKKRKFDINLKSGKTTIILILLTLILLLGTSYLIIDKETKSQFHLQLQLKISVQQKLHI